MISGLKRLAWEMWFAPSHIVYPEDGRQPSYVEGANMQFGGLGPDVPGDRPVRYVVGGIDKDGPEDRGLSERCIVGFNSGPSFYAKFV
ncbi:MAG: hypothetical protein Ct9H300mP22_1810 [Gammaproteobacteria bacterium]|nr:MAG: hypothetical protein Ct9H300mP22_1810 [Gammaproteobacteria bacterium]